MSDTVNLSPALMVFNFLMAAGKTAVIKYFQSIRAKIKLNAIYPSSPLPPRRPPLHHSGDALLEILGSQQNTVVIGLHILLGH